MVARDGGTFAGLPMRGALRAPWGGGLGPGRLDGWSEGYTADTVYPDQANPDMCPTWFSWISVLNGQPPLDESQRLVWLDIGCGTGLGSCAVAAANPNLEVWGVDYNPAHIDRARGFARRAHLSNCQFLEASFEELARGGGACPDEVDVVVVHGVYSWVSRANQQHIAEVIRQRLRPGGLAYVMYESATGWSSMTPLAEALRLFVDADGRRGDLAFHDAAASLLELRDNGARCFPLGPRESAMMDEWPTANPAYAAHEYLGSNFVPLLVDEVFATMGQAKCTFVGSMGPLDYHPYYSIPPDFAELVNRAADPVVAHLVRDTVVQRQLRRDLFRRGSVFAMDPEQMAWLRDLRFGGLGRPFDDDLVGLTAMKVTLDPAYHVPLIEALAADQLDVDAVLAIHPEWTFADAVTALALLVAGGHALPVGASQPLPESVAACGRLNEVILADQGQGRQAEGLVSPVAGAMVLLGDVELMALAAMWSGTPAAGPELVEHALGELAAHDKVVFDAGVAVRDIDAARVVIERRVSGLLPRLPSLERLGIVDPRS